ncbi:MAG TPA: phosphoribosylglycinamide formyltransferase [Clostridiales bacterium UBA8960]|jgi:phosphoribosylglycinamide formyltransferase-1|nr:phosphoribosylglycinamide formyltransferase [Clostridiales bacterium UBA8960]
MRKLRIAVLVSGSGSNLQSIIDSIQSDHLKVEIACVISNRKDAFALERARKVGIEAYYVGKGSHSDEMARNDALKLILDQERVELIVLAGYLAILPENIIKAYKNRIINIHPSLIPKHCGHGYYGIRVHESVLASGDKVSGATVHFVDEGVDTGKIIAQSQIDVEEQDTPETLSQRVLKLEHFLLVHTLRDIASGKIRIGE